MIKCRWWREIILATNYKPFRVKQMSNIEEKLNEISVQADELSRAEQTLNDSILEMVDVKDCISELSTDALNLIHDERLERIDLELNKMADDQLRGLVRKICDERLDVEITFEDKKEKTA